MMLRFLDTNMLSFRRLQCKTPSEATTSAMGIVVDNIDGPYSCVNTAK